LKIYTNSIRLVIFDMDGVIFEGKNFWLELHHAFGTQEQGVASADKYLSRDYDRLVEIVAGKLWKGRYADVYYAMVAERHYQPGVKQVFDFLKENNIRSAIISSGPYELALRAQQDLEIDIIRANRLVIKNGYIAGTVEVMVPDAEKSRVGREVMVEMGIEPNQVMFIGDSDSDVELAKMVKIAVAYNSNSERLIKVCDLVLEYGKLMTLIDHI
jgi:phosphoserine phosphatase